MTTERGNASVAVLALMGIAASVSFAVAHVGALLVEEARAEVAADAAALAGVYGGAAMAMTVANLNGAHLVSVVDELRRGGACAVEVRVGRVVRGAAAMDSWAQPGRTIG